MKGVVCKQDSLRVGYKFSLEKARVVTYVVKWQNGGIQEGVMVLTGKTRGIKQILPLGTVVKGWGIQRSPISTRSYNINKGVLYEKGYNCAGLWGVGRLSLRSWQSCGGEKGGEEGNEVGWIGGRRWKRDIKRRQEETRERQGNGEEGRQVEEEGEIHRSRVPVSGSSIPFEEQGGEDVKTAFPLRGKSK
eukprot:159808-Hanusia_phi.AAC.2